MVRYKKPRASRTGLSHAVARFDLAMAIINQMHDLSADLVNELKKIRKTQEQHNAASDLEDS